MQAFDFYRVAPTKSAAKIASDFQKPDGLTVVYSSQLQKFFENLGVERISGIGPKTQQILKDEMRIQTIGQLGKCDVQKLIDKFGNKNGIWMWQVANGRDHDPVVAREGHITLSSEQTIPSTTNRETILKYLNELVDEIYERVRRRGYEFRTVGVKLVKSDFSIETRETSFSNFQNKRESIASVIEGLLDRFSFISSFSYSADDATTNSSSTTSTRSSSLSSNPVRKIGLRVSNLVGIEKKKPPEQKTLLDYYFD